MNIPIDSMSVSEKLEAIELIWSSLAENPDAVPAPDWHKEELAARSERSRNGETTVSHWNEAEERFDQLGQ